MLENSWHKKEKPLFGLTGLGGGVGSNLVGGDDKVYVKDVFSTDLWVGTGSSKDIENDINLDGEGGMVWIKMRTDGYGHRLIDTERTAEQVIESYDYTVEVTQIGSLTDFNSNGFTVGNAGHTNKLNEDMASWTFRKAPGFFDIVKFEGNGTSQAVAHNLGCIPGCIHFKNLDTGVYWASYHIGLSDPSDKAVNLGENWAEDDDDSYFNDTDPTSTHFTVGDSNSTNMNGDTIIAYLFAAGTDSASQIFGDDGDESIIKMGTYTGTTSLHTIDTGFAVQWVMVKCITDVSDWVLVDTQRGDYTNLYPNEAQAEQVQTAGIKVSPSVASGFSVDGGQGFLNATGRDYIYVAIAAE